MGVCGLKLKGCIGLMGFIEFVGIGFCRVHRIGFRVSHKTYDIT